MMMLLPFWMMMMLSLIQYCDTLKVCVTAPPSLLMERNKLNQWKSKSGRMPRKNVNVDRKNTETQEEPVVGNRLLSGWR